MGKFKLPQLHTSPRKIMSAKLADLMELLAFIPPVHHGFYQQVNGSDDACESESDLESDPPDSSED